MLEHPPRARSRTVPSASRSEVRRLRNIGLVPLCPGCVRLVPIRGIGLEPPCAGPLSHLACRNEPGRDVASCTPCQNPGENGFAWGLDGEDGANARSATPAKGADLGGFARRLAGAGQEVT